MEFSQRVFAGTADPPATQALARTWREAHLHTTDLSWRLTSWALDEPENAVLWHDDAGQLVAWAALQTPFWTIDLIVHPGHEGILFPRILEWADTRARAVSATQYGHPSWYIMVFDDQPDRMQTLESAGWMSQADVGEDSWSKVWMKYAGPIPPATLPDGFTIQSLGDRVDAYVELHQTVFESKNMTTSWRRRTTEHPAHTPDCDLVVCAPDGQLAAFCVGWLEGRQGQVEPLGVHADFRNLGLGKAILAECLRRLQAHGAQEIHVETDNYRNAALDLYEWAGFRVERNVLVFRKDYA